TDTPGIDNIQLSKDKVLLEAKKGVSQIFFLTKDGNFTEEEKEILKFLETVFGNNITNYITIVRTNFTNFKDEEECKKDSKLISNSFVYHKVIHIDNPS